MSRQLLPAPTPERRRSSGAQGLDYVVNLRIGGTTSVFLQSYLSLPTPLVYQQPLRCCQATGAFPRDNLPDIESTPDLSAWNWKDEDELEDESSGGR